MPYLPHLKKAMAGMEDSGPMPSEPPGYYEKTMAVAREWFNALGPLFARVKMYPASREFLIFALLKMLGLMTCLALQRAKLGDGSDTPGLFEPECTEMTELGTRIVHNPYYRRTFAFDTGLIEAMFLICVVCPKREICEEAEAILKLAKGRIEMMANAETYAERCETILKMRFPPAKRTKSV